MWVWDREKQDQSPLSLPNTILPGPFLGTPRVEPTPHPPQGLRFPTETTCHHSIHYPSPEFPWPPGRGPTQRAAHCLAARTLGLNAYRSCP